MTAPTRIGRYEIVRRLGKSMTEVYLAIDTVENRRVALKLVKADGDPVTQLVLEAERRGAAIQKELHHVDPRMVEIYESGDLEGYFFVAMQYVDGRNLAEVLQSERTIDPYRAAVIALEICEQLAKFHSWESAVVHGDIKPSNIHISPNDTVRLLDFGIAKTLRVDSNATIHNFGSPSYCSPERLTRSQVDQQSDLWAVGATLYEMLASVPPYQAENTRKLESLIRSRRPPRALPGNCPFPLRAIVTKALAPNAPQRYGSATEFQQDLQAFLEHRPPVAELERRSNWSATATATLEAARAALRKVTRAGGRVNRKLRLAGALAWFGAGMLLWIGGSYAWQLLQSRAGAADLTHTALPASIPNEGMPGLYVSAADRILESYRASADPWLYDFDWQKAEILLQRAVELGAAGDATLGKLALSRGYATLERLNGAQYSDRAAAQLRLKARDEFARAARNLPRDPHPHLALARVYVYSLPNVERAMLEFAAAERLGASLGRREIEQQADAYRIRAESEVNSDLRAALQDAKTARSLYERIPGFDQADEHRGDLDAIHAPVTRKIRPRRPRRWR
jgi:eukaryotic-like serine/threonine-protein kinase